MKCNVPTRADQRGSMLPMFGGLIFVSFIMIALVVELAMLGVAYRTTASAADASAEAAAAMLSERHAYASQIVVDPARATDEALGVVRALVGSGVDVEVDATPTHVCVTVEDRYEPSTLLFLGVSGVDVTATSCAEPRVG